MQVFENRFWNKTRFFIFSCK